MNDHSWMQHALTLAKRARDQNEVPIGAVIVLNNEIIGEGWNQPISACDPTAHAEVIALRQAAHHITNYRILDATLYVTLEPCPMCASAMLHARIKRLVFAAFDQKAGAAGSVINLLTPKLFNHTLSYEGGVMAEESIALLQSFFKEKRT